MTNLVYLIPVALFLGGVSLLGFLWALRSGQYEDLEGAAQRILLDREPDEDNSTPTQAQSRAQDAFPPAAEPLP